MKKLPVLIMLLLLICFRANSQPHSTKKLLVEMTAAVAANKYVNIHSILIEKGQNLVYERYFNGFTKDSLHDSRSSFKSITSLLAGIAVDKHLIKDVNQKAYSFFPEYAGVTVTKKEITIKNLLQMESGFDCDEWSDDGIDCEQSMTTTHNWLEFSLNLPMKNKPGTVWAYTSCNPMLIGGIISKAANESIMDFAKQNLFAPMGITRYRWTVDPSGNGMTAGSFYILPQDMLKIGYMVRDNGSWKGKRILSAKWIKESTTATIPIPGFSFVRSGRGESAIPQQAFYGYYWYKEVVKTKDYSENVIFASGNGGQYVMIIKRLNLVIVFTQGNYNSWQAKRAFDILAKYIIPALENKKPDRD